MSTYTEIETDVISWLNRVGFTALVAEVETFIQLAQRRIYRTADLNAMLVEVAFDSDTPTIPTGYLRTKSMSTDTGGSTCQIHGAPLKKVKQAGLLGQPRLYTTIGTDFRFGPTPDQVYSIDLVYYGSLTNVSSTVANNWLSDNIPELILFGACMEACLWLKDDARAGVWEGRFSQTLTDLEDSEGKMAYEGGALAVTIDGNVAEDSTRAN
jgi:hypothetical protein